MLSVNSYSYFDELSSRSIDNSPHYGASAGSAGIGGVYVGAVMEGYSTTQIKHLEDRALFTKTARHPDYDDEPLEDRLARRRRNWTPLAAD